MDDKKEAKNKPVDPFKQARGVRRRAGVPINPARRQGGLASGRLHAILCAVAIGVFFAISRRSSTTLPETWALCAGSGGTIYTVDPDMPSPECVVVHQKLIADRGSLKDIRKRWGDKDTTGPIFNAPGISGKTGVKVKYLKEGQAAFPGLIDAHGHVMLYGAYNALKLNGATSVEACVARIHKYVISRPELGNDTTIWIDGQGWDQNRYPTGHFPLAADLEKDEILRGRPIVLARVDYHAYWVSPKVLELLGDLPEEVDGGLIVRDGEGVATGIFVDNAMALVENIKPAWTERQMLGYFETTMRDAVKHGLTSIHDAATYPQDAVFYTKLADQGALPIRLYLMAHMDDDTYWGDQFQKLIGYADERLTLRSVKLFTDGALGSWGAAMLEPYSDQPYNRGIMRISEETIHSMVKAFVDKGWQVNVHCIGDRANHVVLDAFESTELRSYRHRIEHAQIMTQEDIQRIAKLDIIASMQPTHATSDMYYAETRLGPERIKGAYAWKTLLNHGARLALGSDFPVESINPLLGFYAAITRLDANGTSPHGEGGWYPEERLSREEALRGMTIDAAYAALQEDIIGSLTPGKRADIAVLEKDIMTIQPAEMLTTNVRATIVDGAIVYGKL